MLILKEIWEEFQEIIIGSRIKPWMFRMYSRETEENGLTENDVGN